MTFMALSNIIKKHKEQPTYSERQREQEIAQTQTVINTLKSNHDRAFREREAKWEKENPRKKFYQRTEEDDRRESTLDEWFWSFFERAHASESAEIRYQLERNPDHGFGHVPHPKGIHEMDFNKCVPGCRFYAQIGKLTVFDILEDYRGYKQFEEILRAYKELEAEGVLAKE
jgi:hypothetical protein